MRTRSDRQTSPHRPVRRRRSVPLPAPAPVGPGPEARHRAAGGPQDQALYACECGSDFAADVSTSVSCPRCGADQAW